jgi:hypothetical protein
LQTESGSQAFLINITAKSDTRVDLTVSAPLPDLPQTEIVRFSGHNEWTREHTAFIESRHIYTQITSSYL